MRCAIALLSVAWIVAACDQGEQAAPAPGQKALPHASVSDGPHDVAVMQLPGMGEIRIELLPEVAPETVANFVKLASEEFYDGTQFHRVIPGFMLQGGPLQGLRSALPGLSILAIRTSRTYFPKTVTSPWFSKVMPSIPI